MVLVCEIMFKGSRKLLVALKWGFVFVLMVSYYYCLPSPLFKDPTATLVTSKEGKLLGARIASDGQWRTTGLEEVPSKFETCLLLFEDQYFYQHWGFNPVSIFKAMQDNIRAGKVVRGASTLTQQVIRISRKGKKRTYLEKIKEIVLATRLEFRSSKKQILNLYANHAPFGGNVVGLEMASWRYFGIPPKDLSWSESATLAVLPNAPSLLYPGVNSEKLLEKRNRLLQKLLQENKIDSITYKLAKAEDTPKRPQSPKNIAPHLVSRMFQSYRGKQVTTSIDYQLQDQLYRISKSHYQNLSKNQIHNLGVLVMELKSRKVRAYIGNAPTSTIHQKDVDMITAPRSSGSILKPFLYAASYDKGELLPHQYLSDIPTLINDYRPLNFDKSFKGVVGADKALALSLNIPAVLLLQDYGLQRFRDELDFYKFSSIKSSANHYGLSLILGGAEVTLWDLCKAYGYLGGVLQHFTQYESQYYNLELQEPLLLKNQDVSFGNLQGSKALLGAGSIWNIFEALKKVNRPEIDGAWESYASAKQVSWKTGTSFGNRDAWAVGVNPDYVVGVWVGNADGEGRAALTGVQSAAPLLFEVFSLLPRSDKKWFDPPLDDLKLVTTCQKSGYLANTYCPKQSTQIPDVSLNTKICPFHKSIHLNREKNHQVHAGCYPISQMVTQNNFELPTVEAYYYRKQHSGYKNPPPFLPSCSSNSPLLTTAMTFMSPKDKSSIYLPKGFEGETNKFIAKVVHQDPKVKVFWYRGDVYLGSTQRFHEIAIDLPIGKHELWAIDSYGKEIRTRVEVKE